MKLSPDVAALNPDLAPRDRALARLPADIYRSELERRAAREWCPLVFAWFNYETVKLRIPGAAFYTPDFFGMTNSGELAFIEAKGFTKTIRADKLRYNAARETHTWARFCWLEQHGGEWVEKWDVKA